jgi:hypothetical protein
VWRLIWAAIGAFIAGIVGLLALYVTGAYFAIDCSPSMGPDPVTPCFPTFEENPLAYLIPWPAGLLPFAGLLYLWDLAFRRWRNRNAALGREFWLQGHPPVGLNPPKTRTDQPD